jgi:two-component system response regulator PilR (NtrC family)
MSGNETESKPGKRVLVVDDEPEICELLSEVLAGLDLRVDTAQSAVEAMRLYAENKYDLVTLDICMPGTNGVEFHQALSRNFGHGKRVPSVLPPRLPPVLVITGYPEDSLVRELFAGERVVGILQKPVNSEQLLRVVQDLLDWEETRQTRREKAIKRISTRVTKAV